jgi:hypothetical protein
LSTDESTAFLIAAKSVTSSAWLMTIQYQAIEPQIVAARQKLCCRSERSRLETSGC